MQEYDAVQEDLDDDEEYFEQNSGFSVFATLGTLSFVLPFLLPTPSSMNSVNGLFAYVFPAVGTLAFFSYAYATRNTRVHTIISGAGIAVGLVWTVICHGFGLLSLLGLPFFLIALTMNSPASAFLMVILFLSSLILPILGYITAYTAVNKGEIWVPFSGRSSVNSTKLDEEDKELIEKESQKDYEDHEENGNATNRTFSISSQERRRAIVFAVSCVVFILFGIINIL